jgi:hypothetical protein
MLLSALAFGSLSTDLAVVIITVTSLLQLTIDSIMSSRQNNDDRRPDGLLILALAQLVVGLGISLDGRPQTICLLVASIIGATCSGSSGTTRMQLRSHLEQAFSPKASCS